MPQSVPRTSPTEHRTRVSERRLRGLPQTALRRGSTSRRHAHTARVTLERDCSSHQDPFPNELAPTSQFLEPLNATRSAVRIAQACASTCVRTKHYLTWQFHMCCCSCGARPCGAICLLDLVIATHAGPASCSPNGTRTLAVARPGTRSCIHTLQPTTVI